MKHPMSILHDSTCDVCKDKGTLIELLPWRLCFTCAPKAFQEFVESRVSPEQMERELKEEEERLNAGG